MRWISPDLITGMHSFLGSLSTRGAPQSELTIESIREAMLDALGVTGANQYPVIQLRISYANDVQDLWYLRGDIMAALASLEGEGPARTKLAEISDLFRGLLPRGMNSRPSPLSR